MAESCNGCSAWLDLGDGASGLCRAHPPTPMFGTYAGLPGPGHARLESYHPTTTADWWCREFKPAGGAPVVEPAM